MREHSDLRKYWGRRARRRRWGGKIKMAIGNWREGKREREKEGERGREIKAERERQREWGKYEKSLSFGRYFPREFLLNYYSFFYFLWHLSFPVLTITAVVTIYVHKISMLEKTDSSAVLKPEIANCNEVLVKEPFEYFLAHKVWTLDLFLELPERVNKIHKSIVIVDCFSILASMYE